MPEGPSIVILKEQLQPFSGKKILEATGNAKIDMTQITGQKVTAIRSWGKHLLICLPRVTIRVHLLMFGSSSVDEQTKPHPRLSLRFAKGTIYFYSCSVKLLDGGADGLYDWSGDVMNDQWDAAKARRKLKKIPDTLVADALLDQDIFAGVGNIIKNEVLFRIRVHPESLVGSLPPRKLTELIREARNYSFDFLKWKKAYELKKHWLAHAKKICPRDNVPFIKVQHLGKRKRRAFFCELCQIRYPPVKNRPERPLRPQIAAAGGPSTSRSKAAGSSVSRVKADGSSAPRSKPSRSAVPGASVPRSKAAGSSVSRSNITRPKATASSARRSKAAALSASRSTAVAATRAARKGII